MLAIIAGLLVIMTGCQQSPMEDAPIREQGEEAEPLRFNPQLEVVFMQIIELSEQGEYGSVVFEIVNGTNFRLWRHETRWRFVEYFDGEIWRVLPLSKTGGALPGDPYHIELVQASSILRGMFPTPVTFGSRFLPPPFISGGLYRIRETFSIEDRTPFLERELHDVVVEFYWP